MNIFEHNLLHVLAALMLLIMAFTERRAAVQAAELKAELKEAQALTKLAVETAHLSIKQTLQVQDELNKCKIQTKM